MPHPPRVFSFTDDFVFKYIFGRESREPLLIKLLNALLRREGDRQIVALTLLNPFNLKETIDAKSTIVDVKAQDQAGRRYLIEVQVQSRADQIARTLYYLARLYADQLAEGEPFSGLCQATALTLLGHRLFPGHDRVQSIFRFRDVAHGLELSDQLEVHFVELPKVADLLSGKRLEGLHTRFEKWLYVLRYGRRYASGRFCLPRWPSRRTSSWPWTT